MTTTTTPLNWRKETQRANRGPTPSMSVCVGSKYGGGSEAGGGRSSGGGALTSHRPLELKLKMEANVSSGVGGASMRSAAGGR